VDRVKTVRDPLASLSKAERLLGYRPVLPFEDGLEDMFQRLVSFHPMSNQA
jgi:hypothetical protein